MSTDTARSSHWPFPNAEVIHTPALEMSAYGGVSGDPPVVRDVVLVEDETVRAHAVDGAPIVQFTAFLDGTQTVHVRGHERGAPIMQGTVAAVIRERRERRLVTWPHRLPIVRHAYYAPLLYVRERANHERNGWPIVDTSYTKKGTLVPRHPAALRAEALERIGHARESAERELADAWCEMAANAADGGAGVLFVDGGISGSVTTATSSCVVGVIKSHQTLYSLGDGLPTIMSLECGERSSVFRVPHKERTPVVSWYLRLRNPHGHDAMFGLVRVEVADHGDYAARANDVSRWILAEVAPLSLPDGRWDKMVYGIRDCEQFLRAIAS